MLVIQDTLISLDIVQTPFHCHLAVCRGACCTEGDFGAPVTGREMEELNQWRDVILNELDETSVTHIQDMGSFAYYEEAQTWGTACHDDGACVFLVRKPGSIPYCGIENGRRSAGGSCKDFPVRNQLRQRHTNAAESIRGLL